MSDLAKLVEALEENEKIIERIRGILNARHWNNRTTLGFLESASVSAAQPQPGPSISPILKWHGFSLPAIRSKKRSAALALCRHECMYFVHVRLGMSSSRAGEFFNCTHGAVLHARCRIEKILAGKIKILSPATQP